MHKLVAFLNGSKASIAAGILASVLWGLIAAWRMPERDPWTVVLVFAALSLPIFIVGFDILWFDRERSETARLREQQNVERIWEQEAAVNGFWALFGGLIFLDNVGRVFDIGWMSPLSTLHVIVVGGIAFGASYVWQKRHQG